MNTVSRFEVVEANVYPREIGRWCLLDRKEGVIVNYFPTQRQAEAARNRVAAEAANSQPESRQ